LKLGVTLGAPVNNYELIYTGDTKGLSSNPGPYAANSIGALNSVTAALAFMMAVKHRRRVSLH